MSFVRQVSIQFTARRDFLEKALGENEKQAKEILEQLSEESDELKEEQLQTNIGIQRDTVIVKELQDIISKESTRGGQLRERITQLEFTIEVADVELTRLERRRTDNRVNQERNEILITEQEQLVANLNTRLTESKANLIFTDAELEGIENRVVEAESKVKTLGDRIRIASSLLSALAGGVSLIAAVSGETLEAGAAGLLSLGLGTFTQILLLQSVAGVTGNIPLFLILGSLAGTVASSILTIKAFTQRNQQNINAAKRRISGRSNF